MFREAFSLVVSALAFCARGQGFDPRGGREKEIRCPNILYLESFARMTLNKCAVLRIGTLPGGPLCRENHPQCRLKNPTVVYMITCRFSFCKTGVYTVRLLIILERGCSSTYRKKEIKKRSNFISANEHQNQIFHEWR